MLQLANAILKALMVIPVTQEQDSAHVDPWLQDVRVIVAM
jgi:hypothetical protein